MNHILRAHDIIKTDFVYGRGCYLYDTNDRKYTDFESGSWCMALGYSHPRINQVMQAQIERVVHLGARFPNELAEEAALALLNIVAMPEGKCVFLSSGSEAVEFGVQAARRISQQPLLLTLSESYLAAYGSAGAKSADAWYGFDWRPCVDCPLTQVCDPECPQQQAIPFERVGGFVLEPGNASGLVQLPPHALVQMLAKRVKMHQGLVVINEITTGMGRTGDWFGYQHYDLQPDIIAVGKGLGNGYPVSAVIMSQAVAEYLENGGLHYVQSHQNDPLGCAVAREVIQVMRDEGLVERSQRVGAVFRRELKLLAEKHDIIKEVRGRGMMNAMELRNGEQDIPVVAVFSELLQRGLIVGYNLSANLLRFYAPLIIGEEDIAQLVDSLDQILGAR